VKNMKPMNFKKVLVWLGGVLRCPVCGFKYNLDNTKIIESKQTESENSAQILIHSDCQKCTSSVMFNIDINGPEVFSVGMITDLTSQDSAKFSKLEPLSLNDCIQVHKNLSEFKGDFVKLLSVKKTA